ncbi:hypothetical protein Tco_0875970 [Tanacetum coccineum]|uniref:Uncharacterized protein n=1 Tax=Tanacetum coccineum TaxID=301880 RepID=A0ABQ5BVZ1_9ASTR
MKLEKAKGCKTNKEDANSAEWINVQAMDRCRNYKLAVRLQAQEQEEYQLKKGQDQLMLTTTTNLQSLLTRKSFPEVKDDNFQIIRADGSSKSSRILEVFECILLVKIKLLIKKLEDSEDEHSVLGGLLRIKKTSCEHGVNAAKLMLANG